MSFKDMTGKVFGRLTVLENRGPGRRRTISWLCRCDCGEELVISGEGLRSGGTKSCGCLQRERAAQSNTRHGLSNSREYRIWLSMIARCCNENSERYSDYGGRGIHVCDRWRDFEAFYADMGARPSSAFSLDRIDNDKDYEPSNCRWATAREQMLNRRSTLTIELGGKAISLKEACELTGVKYGTAWDRLKRGWPVERALSPKHFSEQGVVLTIPEDIRRAA